MQNSIDTQSMRTSRTSARSALRTSTVRRTDPKRSVSARVNTRALRSARALKAQAL